MLEKVTSLLGKKAQQSSISTSASTQVDWLMVDRIKENIFPNFHVCPRLNRAVQDAKRSKRYKQHVKKVQKPLLKKLSKLLGKSEKDINVNHLEDCIQTHVCHGHTVPDKLASPRLQKEIRDSITQHYHIVAQAITKYAGGPFLKELVEELTHVTKTNTPVKLALYSGHDTGPILPMLHALKVFDGQWPPYASTIIFEVYQSKKTGKHSIRMVYNGKTLTIPGCGNTMCPWDKFLEAAQKSIPSDKDCMETNKKLTSKMVHWLGMFAAGSEIDVLGHNIPASSPLGA
jgi:lysophosphatidic acid phosphatase type 6